MAVGGYREIDRLGYEHNLDALARGLVCNGLIDLAERVGLDHFVERHSTCAKVRHHFRNEFVGVAVALNDALNGVTKGYEIGDLAWQRGAGRCHTNWACRGSDSCRQAGCERCANRPENRSQKTWDQSARVD